MNKMYFQTLVKHGTPTMVQWLESKFPMKEVQGSMLASFMAACLRGGRYFRKKTYVARKFTGNKKILIFKN